jgi:Uncharacterized protein conserved in bacteria (DUF2255)
VSGFRLDHAKLLRDAKTVTIETSAGAGEATHRAIIWIVVDETGRAFVRSWLGARGRWYRELVANPAGTLIAGNRRISLRAAQADADGIEACSRLLSGKYKTSRASLASMLRDEVLDTTLELEPA